MFKKRGQSSELLAFSSARQRKAQVTIFVIIALIIVVAVALFFVFRSTDKSAESSLPSELQPVYDSFLGCLKEEAQTGIRILQDQGGYIELPALETGSLYSPFSSQLRFAGVDVPYWYYVSGNNVQREQVPSRSDMEFQLSRFIEKNIGECDLASYYSDGFLILLEENPEGNTVIQGDEVEVTLKLDLVIEKGFERATVKDHKISISSKLGSLYEDAIKVYEKEQSDLILENYGVDILRLYAPVDGVELTCSPLTWSADEVFDNLENAIEGNTLALKSGNSKDYFDVDFETTNSVRFLNSRNWPRSFEVNPSDGPVMISNPIGNQPGMGILGFCYVDYHFIYDVKYPVLVQVYDGEETFQFPLGIVISGNMPRQAFNASFTNLEIPDLCEYKNSLIEVNTRDEQGRSIDSDISYECSETVCYIGKTVDGTLQGLFPQCVNGKIIARAEGYKEASEVYSSVSSGSVDVYLDSIHTVDVVLNLDNRVYDGDAVINFVSNSSSKTAVYPEQKQIDLTAGEYTVEVYIYKNASLEFPSTVTKQCVEVPKSGVAGILGFTEENCFDVEIPDQLISNVLAGGGSQYYYLTQREIQSSKMVVINAESLPIPKSLDELQTNYLLFDTKNLDITFR